MGDSLKREWRLCRASIQLEYRKPDEAPVIRVSAMRAAAEWVFSIEDNEIGIAPDYQPRYLVFLNACMEKAFLARASSWLSAKS